MTRFLILLLAFSMTAARAQAQTPVEPGCCEASRGPFAGAPIVELKGRIASVHIGFGQGMPSLTVKTTAGDSILYLGSMRYLIERDFNPKVGDEVSAKGFKTANGLFAMTVTLPASNKTLRLRDEAGRPLWRGGPRW